MILNYYWQMILSKVQIDEQMISFAFFLFYKYLFWFCFKVSKLFVYCRISVLPWSGIWSEPRWIIAGDICHLKNGNNIIFLCKEALQAGDTRSPKVPQGSMQEYTQKRSIKYVWNRSLLAAMISAKVRCIFPQKDTTIYLSQCC